MYKQYKKQLSSFQKIAYETILTGLQEMRESIKVLSTDIDSLNTILECIRLDCPWLFYLGKIEYEIYNGWHYSVIKPTYLYNAERVQSLRHQLSIAQKGYIAAVKGKDIWEKVVSIHDNLCQKIAYRQVGMESYSIVGPYIHGESVCEGIAKCFKAICDELNIESCVVIGKAKSSFETQCYEDHAWNQAKINGEWVNIDVTFDLTVSNKGLIRHDYLFLSDEQIKFSHIKTLENGVKCETRHLDYYKVNNLIMANQNEFVMFLERNLKQKNYAFEIKLPSTGDINKVGDKVLDNVRKTLRRLNINKQVAMGINKELLVFSIELH